MIKYKLICKECNLDFDSWFASSKEYEKLKKKNFLNCHRCNSKQIEKTLMTPRLLNKSKPPNEKDFKLKKVSDTIKEYQNYVKNNFKYVGENFAYEARSIHYNNKKKDKGIYGTASNDEMKELLEEGIDAEVIPWVEDKSN